MYHFKSTCILSEYLCAIGKYCTSLSDGHSHKEKCINILAPPSKKSVMLYFPFPALTF